MPKCTAEGGCATLFNPCYNQLSLSLLLAVLVLFSTGDRAQCASPSTRRPTGPSATSDSLVRERPYIGVTFFYWYTWDGEKKLGSWAGQGVHNTPMDGYYDSRTYRDNYRSLWLAGEWGVTHHWMDYWAPNWKGADGRMREKTVMRAAEDLRKAGYNIWMSYYQDGSNFETKDFVKNVSEKRDVYQWLRDFSRSPVWPKIRDRPMQLVYSRNGAPETTIDHEGFRVFLRKRYSTIAKLNEDWRSDFDSFDEITMSFAARGRRRAWSARYQHHMWRQAWRKLDDEVSKQFTWPGMVASFDVGYGPFKNLGYAEFAKTFGGPHSYAGIFKQPHHQDADRFIQANVCKAYDTVFFDHYKNYYHDWNIRVPGMGYLPDPHNFDCFWVGDLMRYAEAVLHLSWNEWWEGSNLEPCMEWGKIYCRKNLFYSTVMQMCHESIRDWSKGARVGFLLNDYAVQAGTMTPEEVTDTLQALRRLNCDFDLIADDFVTPARLADFKVVVAPAAGTGFGYNINDKRIGPVLLDWVKGHADRRLIVSADQDVRRVLGIKSAKPDKAAKKPGDDLNLFVDVGVEGDDRFLIAGRTHREKWGKLPAGKFGAGSNLTARWTPGLDETSTLHLPLSPHRDHKLRLAGSAIWPCTATVMLDGRRIGRLEVKPGISEYELAVPASAVGGRMSAMLDLRYDPIRVPCKMDPKRFPSEARNCNLALDWLQIATSNIPARTTTQRFEMPKGRVRFGSKLLGRLNRRGIQIPMRMRTQLDGRGARVLSVYGDASPRDLLVKHGQGSVWYVNGLFSDVADAEYWRSILANWAGTPAAELVRGRSSAGAKLNAGQTDLLCVYNYESGRNDAIRCRLPARSWPLSEAVALAKDGATYQPVKTRRNGSWYEWDDTLSHYAVYQLAFAPLRVETDAITVSIGRESKISARVTNVTDRTVQAGLRFRSVIPTLSGKAVKVDLRPGKSTTVALPLMIAKTADWGRKTAVIEIESGGKRAYLWREVVVLRPPELRLTRRMIPSGEPMLEVANARCLFGDAEPAMDVVATVGKRRTRLGQIPAGGKVSKALTLPATSSESSSNKAALLPLTVTLTRKDDGRKPPAGRQRVWLARPAASAKRFDGAVASVSVFNHYDRPLKNDIVELPLPKSLAAAGPYHLRDAQGQPIPTQVVDGSRMLLPANVPARGATSYVLCKNQAATHQTDLFVTADRPTKGAITVGNSYYRVAIDPSAGGSVTQFVSQRTGRDYGLRSFDVNYGRFSRYDPNKPATNTVSFIHEAKTSLSKQRCKLARADTGPIRAAVVAEVADENVRCRTTYEFLAHTPYFRLHRRVTFVGKQRPQEIVVVDARFRRNTLSKSYPNFVGLLSDGPRPHFGWRYGNWVPDVLTLTSPPKFEESVSMVLFRKDGLDQVRQGFWPADRPKPGPCQQARVELIARRATVCDVELVVHLHENHQIAAKRLLEELNDPPMATLTMDPLWQRPK